eukprot:TRINITY_DN2346_c0_g5_i1.p1 TRINITY_DN2346_c0_g5~~TRINITY_DN2346_c0_g5_i1.p1  ORF type:complete len:800 (+),score=301.70 TRINITY_DN2346_c0_g5_i1:84-2483(+)
MADNVEEFGENEDFGEEIFETQGLPVSFKNTGFRSEKWESVDFGDQLDSLGDFGLLEVEEISQDDYEFELKKLESLNTKKTKKESKKRSTEQVEEEDKTDLVEKKKTETTEPSKKKKKETHFCEICRVEVGGGDSIPMHYNGKKHKKKAELAEKGELVHEEKVVTKKNIKKTKNKKTETVVENVVDNGTDYSEWKIMGLHEELIASLRKLGFKTPTPIQQSVVARAMRSRKNVLGAAPTGSGKTLAFVLPIMQRLLEERDAFQSKGKQYESRLRAIIISPTRELAKQIHEHLEALRSNSMPFSSMLVVGGLAEVKQERLLARSPEIIIATPGRLWGMIESGHAHFKDMVDLDFLVLDEADRMMESGHYQELEQIIKKINVDTKPMNEDFVMLENDVNPNALIKEKAKEQKKKKPVKRQVFLFSATLNLEAGEGNVGKNKKQKKHSHGRKKTMSPLESLISRCKLGSNTITVDMAENEVTNEDVAQTINLPKTLELCKVECPDGQRDQYLFYFLRQYRGRTIIFVNTISTLKRVLVLLQTLKQNVFALHASMQQKQRLKYLEKYQADPNGILVATDVAARGLDIPDIDYVIHYQMSPSLDVFVHRSGRTARAGKNGMALCMVGPHDVRSYLRVCEAMSVENIPHLPVDERLLFKLTDAIRLAKNIMEAKVHDQTRSTQERWVRTQSEKMDITLDDDERADLIGKKSDAVKLSTKQMKYVMRQLDTLLEELLEHSTHLPGKFIAANGQGLAKDKSGRLILSVDLGNTVSQDLKIQEQKGGKQKESLIAASRRSMRSKNRRR